MSSSLALNTCCIGLFRHKEVLKFHHTTNVRLAIREKVGAKNCAEQDYLCLVLSCLPDLELTDLAYQIRARMIIRS